MKLRSTIIICVLAVLGVVAASMTERYVPRSASGRGTEPTRLTPKDEIPIDDVNEIRLQLAGEPERVYERDGETWRQTAPFPHPMDAYSMRELVRTAANVLVLDEVDVDLLRPTALGFAPPKARLELKWGDSGTTYILGRVAIAGRAYLKRDGDDSVYVVDQSLHERATGMNEREWRDRRLFHGIGVESERIEIQVADIDTVLVRRRKTWGMESPVRARVDQTALDELFTILGRASSNGFIIDQPESLGKFGLEPPAGMIAVYTPQPAEPAGGAGPGLPGMAMQRLRLGGRIGVGTQDRFGLMEGRPVVLRLAATVWPRLVPDPATLVEPTATGIEPADVKQIRITTKRTQVDLERELERWRARSHGGVEVPAEIVRDLLDILHELRATSVKLVPYPREYEVATITLYGTGNHALDTVRLVREPESEGGRWGAENGDDALRVYPAELEIPIEPQAFGLPK